MPTISLRSALALAFGAVSVLMALVISWSINQIASDAIRRDIGTALTELAEQMRSRLDMGLYERLRDVDTLTVLRQLRDPATRVGDNRLVLEKLRRSTGEIAWIGFARNDGLVVYSADGLLEGANVGARPWFKAGREGPFVGDVHEAKLLAKLLPAPANGEPLRFVDVAAPVFDLQGRLSGVLGVHLSWEWARNIEQTVFSLGRRNKGVETFVLNRDGQILLAPAGREATKLPTRLSSAHQDGGQLLQWPDGGWYLTAVVGTRGFGDYAGLGWSVLVRQDAEQAYAPVRELRSAVLTIGAGFAVLFALFGIWLAGRISQPLRELTRVAHRLQSGEADAVLPSHKRFHEPKLLADALRHLLATLRQEQTKLAELNANLENQVTERTEALDAANRHLLLSLEERQRLVKQLETQANTDSLTGLLNRRAFHERAQQEILRQARQHTALSVLIFDIDHFKQINDLYGHEAGDEALRQLALAAQEWLREMDVLARFGGEEFVALLPDSDLEAARRVAERMRQAAAELQISYPSGVIRLTLSFGVAQWRPEQAMDALIAQADQALYTAKHKGRNRVEAWIG